MLAIEINVLLEVNIKSFSLHLTDEKVLATSNLFRILPIKITFYFEISWVATLQFKEILREKKRENIYVAVEI